MQMARKGGHAFCVYLLDSFACSMVPVDGGNSIFPTTEIVDAEM